MIFKYIPKDRLPEYFIGLLNHVCENPNFSILKIKNDMTLLPLLVQVRVWVFFLYFFNELSFRRSLLGY